MAPTEAVIKVCEHCQLVAKQLTAPHFKCPILVHAYFHMNASLAHASHNTTDHDAIRVQAPDSGR